jgi:NAD(P)-dependent dehydrogenase (short-subunit alcohol dehydrogenase family)
MASEVAVLIGTGSIGLAIIRRAAIGRVLLLADRNEAQLKYNAELLRNEGYNVETQPVDVSDEEAVVSLAKLAASLGTVARVVHAAGVSPNQAPPDQIVRVDLLGTIHVLDAFGEVIGDHGSGVVIASQAGHMGERLSVELEHDLANKSASEIEKLPALSELTNSGAAYIMAKRANALRVQAAAVTWAQRGARVNCISPGIICTPLARDEMGGPYAEAYKQMIKGSPAGRMGNPSEVAEVAAFLLDERGSFIAGADFLMDGGVIATMKTSIPKP